MLRLPPFRYHRPDRLDDAVGLLNEHAGTALAMAGGTDLVPNMKHRLFEPQHVVSLRGIGALRGIGVQDGALVIGAGESLAAVAASAEVRRHAPSLAAAAGQVAGPQLRNAGTIGGNLCLDTRCTYYNQSWFWRRSLGFCLKKDGDTCHVTRVGTKCVAAHSADTPPVLMTLDAVAEMASMDGERTVPVAEFFVPDGIANTVRRPDEVVTRIRVPLPGPGTRTVFRKLRQRNSIDFPLLNVAIAAELRDSVLHDLRVVVSGLGARPREVSGLDEVLGRRLDVDAIEAVAQRAYQQCRPLTNMIVDPTWRRAMVPVQVRRALMELAGQAR